MVNKIVALNSGGFDSICLMYYLKEHFPDSEIITLFFNYGQNSYESEKKCAETICDKLGYNFNEITLPKFNWSKSGLISDGSNPYLEMRNLIFLSYAVSVSQSCGCKDIFIAFIKPQSYPDTSFEFLSRMNTLISDLGIHVHAPFHSLDKEELIPYIRRYCITPNNFCSCLGTEPTTGIKCSNCEYFEEIYDFLKPLLPKDLYVCGDIETLYSEARMSPIVNAKLFINDVCNMKCDYCLTNGTEPMCRDYDISYWVKVITHLYNLGVKNIDFTGKEPFINRDIFSILDSLPHHVKENLKFSAITNGKNLSKYAELISKSDIGQVTISDDGGVIRDVEVISLISEYLNLIPNLSVSFDLHSRNKDIAVTHISNLLSIGVDVYVKPILSYKGMFKEFQLSQPDFYWVIDNLCDSLTDEQKKRLIVSVPFQYGDINEKILMGTDLNTDTYRGITFSQDLFCVSGFDTVFVYSDGSFSGCGNVIFSNRNSDSLHILDIVSRDDLKSHIFTDGERMCCKNKIQPY